VIAQVHGLIEVVGNEDDGLIESALQLEKLILHFATNKRIKGRKSLIHEQDVSLGCECTSQTNSLLHATGKLMRILVSPPIKTDSVQPLVGLLKAFLLLELALQLQPVGRIFTHSKMRK